MQRSSGRCASPRCGARHRVRRAAPISRRERCDATLDARAVRRPSSRRRDREPRRALDYGVIADNGPSGPSCPFPWNFVAIDMHGNVVPCGWSHGEPVMGNIHEQDFFSIWRSERYEALRSRHLERRLEGACARCPAAGMGTPDATGAFAPR